jgi:large subunit GTPase 1
VVLWLFGIDLASPRRIWADYFDSQGLRYAFYSATDATARQEALREALISGEPTTVIDEVAEENERVASSEEDGDVGAKESALDLDTASAGSYESGISDEDEDADSDSDGETHDNGDSRAKVLSVLELEDLFIASAPDLSGEFLSVSDRLYI